MDDINDKEFNFLVTRANFNQRKIAQDPEMSLSQNNRKTPYKSKFISCSAHHSSPNKTCSECITFPIQETLPNGKLPTVKQVLAYYFYVTNTEGVDFNTVAADVMIHWIVCNVYTKCLKSVNQNLNEIVNTYNNLKKVTKSKKGLTFSSNLRKFSEECNRLFDIRCLDLKRIQRQEKLWKVKETDIEGQFYAGQCKIPQVCYYF